MDIQLEKKKGFQKKHIPYVAGGALFLILVGWIVFGDHASTLKVDARGVNIGNVTKEQFNDFVRVNGQVQPITVVQLSPEEGGIVQEKVVEEGAQVKKGDVIIRLSNSNLDLQILDAEAQLAEKQNFLRNTQVTMEQDKLNNQLEKAQLDVDMTRYRRAYNQQKKLYEENLIAKEEFLKAKEDFELASKKYDLVVERLRQDSISRTIQMDEMETSLSNMRKNIALVHERKEHLNVRSQIDGELGLLDVVLGQNVSAGQKIGQINDLSDYKIEALIDEHYIDRVKKGLSATFERQGSDFELNVRKVYPEVRSFVRISPLPVNAQIISVADRPITLIWNLDSRQKVSSSRVEPFFRAQEVAGYSFLTKTARKHIAARSRLVARTRNITKSSMALKRVKR